MIDGPAGGRLPALDAIFPGLAARLAPAPGGLPPADLRAAPTPSGLPTLIVRGLHAHSPRDPLREARRLVDALPPNGPVVILGLGLAYTAELALDRPLLIVERRPEILRKAIETRDLLPFLQKCRDNGAALVVGDDPGAPLTALALLEQRFSRLGQPTFLKNRAIVALDEAWYAGVENTLRAFAARDDVNQATERRFGKRWARNAERNLEAIRDLPGVRLLDDLLSVGGAAPHTPCREAEGLPDPPLEQPAPVFLAAGGPSLDEINDYLPALRERCLVIAVDTSLRYLLAHGVDPDFVVSTDPQYWNFRHLDQCPAPRSILVTEAAVYPPTLRHVFAAVYLASSRVPLARRVEDRVDPKGPLASGGSVATAAWDLARRLGAATILAAGLDLAYPGLRTHFRGALFETRALSASTRLRPAETWQHHALHDAAPFYARDPQGRPILTDARLALYAAWFETALRARPRVRTLRLSPHALAIQGMDNMEKAALPAVLDRFPPRRPEIDALLAARQAAVAAAFHAPQARAARAAAFRAC